MKVEFIATTQELQAQFERLLHDATDVWIASAWATKSTPVFERLCGAKPRLRALVIGLDFAGTDPSFIRAFWKHIRLVDGIDGTFHPKVYLFRSSESWDAIIGSSNLTSGGFVANTEASIHLSGPGESEPFSSIRDYVEDLARGAPRRTRSELYSYEKKWKSWRRQTRSVRARFGGAGRGARKPYSARAGLPNVDWNGFVRILRNLQSKHPVFPQEDGDSYIDVATENSRLFRLRAKFSGMSPTERAQVAGLRKDRFAWFGSNSRAYAFASVVNDHASELDAALEQIPIAPTEVKRAHFEACLAKYPAKRGFGSPGVLSRLLAMKRPDTFLCVNGANRKGLAQAVGMSQNHLNTFDGYWELHERLWSLPWFRSARPHGEEGLIWDARVALLDAIYYPG